MGEIFQSTASSYSISGRYYDALLDFMYRFLSNQHHKYSPEWSQHSIPDTFKVVHNPPIILVDVQRGDVQTNKLLGNETVLMISSTPARRKINVEVYSAQNLVLNLSGLLEKLNSLSEGDCL